MLKNNCGGLLVAIDGPNGVGKSTLINHLSQVLQNASIVVYVTREPTASELGDFTRQIAEKTLKGNSLACLVAADRYYHLEHDVIPHLVNNDVVIIDRYILSSLILQRMDNVDVMFILSINDKIILPDIQFAITAHSETIQTRLDKRELLTRFERDKRTNEELLYLKDGVEILSRIGVKIIPIDNTDNLNMNVAFMADHIKKVMEARSL